MFTVRSWTFMLSTTSSPCWISSRRLMQRMSVLFPEPLGPQTTITSPRLTWRSMSLRTCGSPNHLLTLENLIMPPSLHLSPALEPRRHHRHTPFEVVGYADERIADDKVQNAHKAEHHEPLGDTLHRQPAGPGDIGHPDGG